MKASSVILWGLGAVTVLGLGTAAFVLATTTELERQIAADSLQAQKMARAVSQAWLAGVRDPEQLEAVTMRVVLSPEERAAYEQSSPEQWPESVRITRTNAQNLVARAVPVLEAT